MKKAILISAIVAVIGGAAYYFYKRQIDLLYNLQYKLIGIRIQKIGLDNTEFDLSLRIYSQSTIEAKITGMQVDIYMNGVQVAKVDSVENIIIPAKGYSDTTLHVVMQPKTAGQGLMMQASEIIKARDSKILINGYAKVQSAFLNISVPISYETTIRELVA